MSRFLLLLGFLLSTSSVLAGDPFAMAMKEDVQETRGRNARIEAVAVAQVHEIVRSIVLRHGNVALDPSAEELTANTEQNRAIQDLVARRYQEVKDDFLKGRYDRSKARLPENIEAWRAEADISNPGADLSNFPNSAFTLPQGRVYLESAPVTWYGAGPMSAPQYNAQFLLRYGATDDIELRLFGNGPSWRGGFNETAGFAPLAFDTKIHLLDEREDLFLPAVGFEGYIQTALLGSRGFSNGTYGGMSLNFDQSLPFEIDAEYNVGTNQTRKFNGETCWQFNAQWALQKDVLDKDVAVFIHGFYNAMTLPRLPVLVVANVQDPRRLDAKTPEIAAIGGGLLWTLGQRLVIWGQASGGVTHYSPSVITDLGFAVAF